MVVFVSRVSPGFQPLCMPLVANVVVINESHSMLLNATWTLLHGHVLLPFGPQVGQQVASCPVPFRSMSGSFVPHVFAVPVNAPPSPVRLSVDRSRMSTVPVP